MCESRKERSDGIAIATKSIASSALPVGLCRRQKEETREEGGHVLEGIMHSALYSVLVVREGWARRVCAIAIATKSIASKLGAKCATCFAYVCSRLCFALS